MVPRTLGWGRGGKISYLVFCKLSNHITVTVLLLKPECHSTTSIRIALSFRVPQTPGLKVKEA